MVSLNNRFLDLLKKRIVIFDGSFGALIREINIPKEAFQGAEGFSEILNITKPEIITEVTEAYFKAGADVVQTNSFTANPLKVMEFGFPREKTYEINKAAATIARKAAAKYSTKDRKRFVRGSIGPSGFLPSSTDPALSNITYDELVQNYYEQALGLIDGGIDMFIIETQQDILETKATITGLKKAMKEKNKHLPVICQVTLDINQNMLLGTNIQSVLTTLSSFDIDVIGLNCSTGPKEMTDTVRFLCSNTHLPISVIPNAGIPYNDKGKTVYPLKAEEMLDHMKPFVYEYGINIVGACCGSNPEFIELMEKEFYGKKPKKREVTKTYAVSSGMTSVSLEQEPRPLLIGETTNATGSRKFLRLLKEEKYEEIIEMAKSQTESGSHLLDVSVAHNDLEKPESYYMQKVIKLLSNTVSAPLVIDSTDTKVIEAGLKLYPGKAMLNSINLEGKGERIHDVLKLIKEFGGAVIALTIDEKGMAETAEKKYEVAKRMHAIHTKEYRLDQQELFIDALTFPLTTGESKYRNSAVETLNAIQMIKERLPGTKTILGISNVSFGIPMEARKILNSIFLYHAVQQGLDAAIINSSHLIPYSDISDKEKKLFEDLIFNRDENALQIVIEYCSKTTFKEEKLDAFPDAPVEQRIANNIIVRQHTNLIENLEEARKKYSAVDIINTLLIPAMREVGDRFGRGEYILPFVLEAAGIMKKAVAHLEQYLEKQDSYTQGTLVLATVYGDVHDIGKNLVKTIVENNGFKVIDLGKQVPVQTIIETAKKEKADVIGLSALLVSTSKQMKLVIEELDRQDLEIPVMVSGASINARYAKEISTIDNHKYKGGVFYAKDAFEGFALMQKLTSEKKAELIQNYLDEMPEIKQEKPVEYIEHPIPSIVSVGIPKPPFMETRIFHAQVEELWPYLNENMLFRYGWGLKGTSMEEYQKYVNGKFRPLLEKLKKEAKIWLHPSAIYGYFSCRADNNRLMVHDNGNGLTTFTFPRYAKSPHTTLTDYFSSKEHDILPAFLVTMGSEVERYVAELNENGDYAKSLYVSSLANYTAESLVRFMKEKIMQELGFPKEQGQFFAFGYRECPDMEQQKKLYALLDGKRINVTLTSSFHLEPEASSAGFVVYHKDVKSWT